MADLYIMCGVPGSGKSTFLNNHVNKDTSIIVSRDEIRFSIVKPDEDYFSHEQEVCKIFWKKINEGLASGKNVFADQTSLTKKSRAWLLQHIKGYHHANIVWIDETLETCLERNEKRKGTHAYVPPFKVNQMFNNFVEPTIKEGFYRVFRYNSKEDKLTYKGVII